VVSADVPDWSREAYRGWNPPRALIASIRAYQRIGERRGIVAWTRRKVLVARHRFWSAVTGADIPLNSRIGGGLLIPHPNGIVIHPDAIVGPNCLLFQQVTIGATARGVPTIGGHVDIGAGAKVIGPVTVGAHAAIGANAVVIADVPPDCVVAGIPARVVGRTSGAD
jgi:serine O-acetyltransferase